MLLGLLQNFWLGFIITATPGAVIIEALRRSIHPGLHLREFVVGNFVGMLMVVALAVTGVSVLRNSLAGSILVIISGAILIYLGATALFTSSRSITTNKVIPTSSFASFITGTTLAVANPLSFIFWLSLIGRFRKTSSVATTMLNIGAVILGALAVFIILIILNTRLGANLNQSRQRLLSRLFGIIIILYGIVILYKGVT